MADYTYVFLPEDDPERLEKEGLDNWEHWHEGSVFISGEWVDAKFPVIVDESPTKKKTEEKPKDAGRFTFTDGYIGYVKEDGSENLLPVIWRPGSLNIVVWRRHAADVCLVLNNGVPKHVFP